MRGCFKVGVGGRAARSEKRLLMSKICPFGIIKVFVSNVVTVAYIWEEHTKNQWFICLRQVSCMMSEIYFKLLVKKKANHIPLFPSLCLITVH